jgi:hypothetical protein
LLPPFGAAAQEWSAVAQAAAFLAADLERISGYTPPMTSRCIRAVMAAPIHPNSASSFSCAAP